MLPFHSFASLSKCIMTKQVKMLNYLYGAACDHQYVLTAKPTLSKQMTITHRINDESKEWSKQNSVQIGGIFTAASAVYKMPVEGARRKRGGRRRGHSKRSVGSGRSRERIPMFETGGMDYDGNEYLHHKRGVGAGICEECGGPLHLPRAPAQNTEKDLQKSPSQNIPDVGAETERKPDLNTPSVVSEKLS